MTPKEAIIRKELEKLTDTHYEPQRTEDIDNAMEVIKQALTTPPTVDEVCKALSEHLKEEVKYIPHKLKKNGFYLVKSGIYLVSLGDDNQVNFSYNDWIKFNRLPPSLITLIGKFYESLEEK